MQEKDIIKAKKELANLYLLLKITKKEEVVMDMINKLKYQKASLHQKINYLKKEAMISFAINENEFDNMNNIENENNMFKYKMENRIEIKKKKINKRR